jgi:hypothetical protein
MRLYRIKIVEIAFLENVTLTIVDELVASLEDEHSGLTLIGIAVGRKIEWQLDYVRIQKTVPSLVGERLILVP